jgi:hypothetical protein
MWRDAVALLREQGTWDDADAPVLERVILNRQAAERAHAEAAAEPWVTGSTGQLVAHPGFAVAARCDQVAVSLARQLMLTPEMRRRVDPGRCDDRATWEELDAFSAPPISLADLRRQRAASTEPKEQHR